MSNIQVSRLTGDFIEDTVKPFLKANEKNLSCLRDLQNSDKKAESVIIALVKTYQYQERQCGKYIQLFDFTKEKWIPLMKIPEEYVVVKPDFFAIDNNIVLVSVSDTTKALVCNAMTGKINHSKINIPEFNKVVGLEGRLYAIGLSLRDSCAKVLEDGEWKIRASMSRERHLAKVATHDGKIYVFGGEQYDEIPSQTAEVYDPVKDEWESIPAMSTARSCAGVASLEGKIFVVGGCGWIEDDYEDLGCGECYDPKTKMWTRIPNMIDAESMIDAVANNGALFVTKNKDKDKGDIDVIERFCPKSSTWNTVKVKNSADFDDFRIKALCTLNKKYLPQTLFNMNNNEK